MLSLLFEIIIEIFSPLKIFLITFKIFNKIFELCSNFLKHSYISYLLLMLYIFTKNLKINRIFKNFIKIV